MDSPATRRQHHEASQDRLRRYILVGLCVVGSVVGAIGALVAIMGNEMDRSLVLAFFPDIVVAIIVLWMVYGLRRLHTAIHLYMAYFALNYAFFALSADGFKVFLTPWIVLPPICGFYLGGRRLGVLLTATIALEAATAAVVQLLGTGHHLIVIPALDDPEMMAMLALSVLEIFTVVTVFEWSRARNHDQLDQVLGKLDEQAQTVVSLVENVSDVILLLDSGHRVVTHNHAAAAAFPMLSPGADFFDAMAPARRNQWQRWFESAKAGNVQAEESMRTADGVRHFEFSFSRVASGDHLIGFTLVARDLSKRREADAAMRRMRGQLLDASRRAGMAEVAASLLHNLGNTLNGASVSASHLRASAQTLGVDAVRHSAGLLREHSDALATVLGDKAGKLLAFLDGVADHLEVQRGAMAAEAAELHDQIGRVASVLASHEDKVRVREVYEEVDLDDLLASALAAEEDGGQGPRVVHDLEPTGTILTIRHKLLQVMVSMLQQARDGDRGVHITLRCVGVDRITLAVGDRGAAIPATDLFTQGSPLHGAALAAVELGGSLRHQDGRLVLELPRVALTPARSTLAP